MLAFIGVVLRLGLMVMAVRIGALVSSGLA
jgi:hypothetical protein